MNGLYEPNEIQKKTAMILLQTPLGQALKGEIRMQYILRF